MSVEIDEGDGGLFAAVVILTFVGIVLLYWLWIKSVRIVRHSEVMILERFGKYHRTLKPGLHFTIPIIEAPRQVHWRYLNVNYNSSATRVVSIVTDRIDTREHVLDFGRQHVITKDTVQLDIDALVYFRITDPRVAVFKIQNVPDAIELLTQATLRNVIAQMTLDDTFSSREQINAELLSKVQRDAERWGVTITRVEIFNILPPHDIRSAMENQIKSERERRSTVLQADGERESAVIRSRGDAARLVLLAEGRRAADLLRAKGEADAKQLHAKAESDSIRSIMDAVEGSGVRAVDYLTALEYLSTLCAITTPRDPKHRSGKVVLLPTETLDSVQAIMRMNQRG